MADSTTIFDDIIEVSDRKFDPFAPMLVIHPIVGFPKTEDDSPENDGKDYVLSVRDRLQNFVLVDDEKKIDTLSITFIDDNGSFVDANNLVHGAVIDVAWGYKGKMSQPRRMIVRRLKIGMVQGRKWARRRRGYLVTIEGLAPAISQHTKGASGEDFFENRTLSVIVRTIAERMGYHESSKGSAALNIAIPGDRDTIIPVVPRPAGMTYPQFLMFLADAYGMRFTTGTSGMFFGERDLNRAPAVTVDMSGTTLLGFDLDGDLTLGSPAGLTVVGYHPGKRQTVMVKHNFDETIHAKGLAPHLAHTEAEADDKPAPGENEKIVEGAVVFGDKKQSVASALKRTQTVMEDWRPTTHTGSLSKMIQGFHERKKRAWKLRVRLVGDPYITGGQLLNMENFESALLDGIWEIKEVRHTIDTSYVTELTCHRWVGRKTKGTGDIVTTFVKSTARNKDQEHRDYDKDGAVEGVILFGASSGNPVKKTRVRDGYSTHTYKANK